LSFSIAFLEEEGEEDEEENGVLINTEGAFAR
jgi:hypothetical protein